MASGEKENFVLINQEGPTRKYTNNFNLKHSSLLEMIIYKQENWLKSQKGTIFKEHG